MDILKKIQNQPERLKKIILWSITIVIGIVLITPLMKNFQQKLKSFEIEKFKEELKLPSFEMPNMPTVSTQPIQQ